MAEISNSPIKLNACAHPVEDGKRAPVYAQVGPTHCVTHYHNAQQGIVKASDKTTNYFYRLKLVKRQCPILQ